nr:hypothetical protein L204_04638 [Cryptococcus depauperatus CBS 7855]
MLQVSLSSPAQTVETMVSYTSSASPKHSAVHTAFTTPNLSTPSKTNVTLEPMLKAMEDYQIHTTPVRDGSLKIMELPKSEVNALGLSGGLKVKDVASRFEQMRASQMSSPTPIKPYSSTTPRQLSASPCQPRQIEMAMSDSDEPVKQLFSDWSLTLRDSPSPSGNAFPAPELPVLRAEDPIKSSTLVAPVAREKGSTLRMIRHWETQNTVPTQTEVQNSLQDVDGVVAREYLDEKPLPPSKHIPASISIPIPAVYGISETIRHKPPCSTSPCQNYLNRPPTPTESASKSAESLTSSSNDHYSPWLNNSHERKKASPLKDVLNFLNSRIKAKGREKDPKKGHRSLGIIDERERFGLFIPRDRMGSAEMRRSSDYKPTIRSNPIVYLIPTPCSSISPWDAWLPSWAHLTTDTLSITYCPVFPTPRSGSASAPRRCLETQNRAMKGVPFASISAPNPLTPADRTFSMGQCLDVKVLKKDEMKSRNLPPAPDGVSAEIIELSWEDGSRSYIAVEGPDGRKAWLTAIRGLLPRTPVLPPISPAETPQGTVSPSLCPPSFQTRQSVGTITDANYNAFPLVQKFGNEWIAGGALAITNGETDSQSKADEEGNSPTNEETPRVFADLPSSEPNLDDHYLPWNSDNMERASSPHSSAASKKVINWQGPIHTERELSIFARDKELANSPYHRLGDDDHLSVFLPSDTMLSFDSDDLNPSRSASQVGRPLSPSAKKNDDIPLPCTRENEEIKAKAALWESKSLPTLLDKDCFVKSPSELTHLTFPKPIVDGKRLPCSPNRIQLSNDQRRELSSKKSIDHWQPSISSPSRITRMAMEDLPPNEMLEFVTEPLNVVKRPSDSHVVSRSLSTDALVSTPRVERTLCNVSPTSVSRACTPEGKAVVKASESETEPHLSDAVTLLRPVSALAWDNQISTSTDIMPTPRTAPSPRAVTPGIPTKLSASKDLVIGAISSPASLMFSAAQRPVNRNSLSSFSLPSYALMRDGEKQSAKSTLEVEVIETTSAVSTRFEEVNNIKEMTFCPSSLLQPIPSSTSILSKDIATKKEEPISDDPFLRAEQTFDLSLISLRPSSALGNQQVALSICDPCPPPRPVSDTWEGGSLLSSPTRRSASPLGHHFPTIRVNPSLAGAVTDTMKTNDEPPVLSRPISALSCQDIISAQYKPCTLSPLASTSWQSSPSRRPQLTSTPRRPINSDETKEKEGLRSASVAATVIETQDEPPTSSRPANVQRGQEIALAQYEPPPLSRPASVFWQHCPSQLQSLHEQASLLDHHSTVTRVSSKSENTVSQAAEIYDMPHVSATSVNALSHEDKLRSQSDSVSYLDSAINQSNNTELRDPNEYFKTSNALAGDTETCDFHHKTLTGNSYCPGVNVSLPYDYSSIHSKNILPPSEDISHLGKVLHDVEVLINRTQSMSDPATAPYPQALQDKLDALHDDLKEVRSLIHEKPGEQSLAVTERELPPLPSATEPLDVGRLFKHLQTLEGRTSVMANPDSAPYPKVMEQRLSVLFDEITAVRRLLEEKNDSRAESTLSFQNMENVAPNSFVFREESNDRSVPMNNIEMTEPTLETFPKTRSTDTMGSFSRDDMTRVNMYEVPKPVEKDISAGSVPLAEPSQSSSQAMATFPAAPEVADVAHRNTTFSIQEPSTAFNNISRSPARSSDHPAHRRSRVATSRPPLHPSYISRKRPPVLSIPAPLADQTPRVGLRSILVPTPSRQDGQGMPGSMPFTPLIFPPSPVQELPELTLASPATAKMPEPFSHLKSPLTSTHLDASMESVHEVPSVVPAAFELNELHRKLDHLTVLYQEFLSLQKEGSQSGDAQSQTETLVKEAKDEVAVVSTEAEAQEISTMETKENDAQNQAAIIKDQKLIKTPNKLEGGEEVLADEPREDVTDSREASKKPKKTQEEMSPVKPKDAPKEELNKVSKDAPKSIAQETSNNVIKDAPNSSTSRSQIAPNEIMKKLEEALIILKALDEAKDYQKITNADFSKYVADLSAWLEKSIKDTSDHFVTVGSKLDHLGDLVDSRNNKEKDATGMIMEIKTTLDEQNHKLDANALMEQRLDALVNMMGQAEERNSKQTDAIAQIIHMIETHRYEDQLALSALKKDLFEEARLRNLHFMEEMSKATSTNVQNHIEGFKKMLNAEVNKSMSELGRVREEKRALEQQISDLFALKAKHGVSTLKIRPNSTPNPNLQQLELRALPKPPIAASTRSPAK